MTARRIIKKHGLGNTHWGRVIINAEKRGHFHFEHRERSGDWGLCACGKITGGIDRIGGSNAPSDGVLYNLGVNFERSVRANDFKDSARTLVQIESRVSYLLGKEAEHA